MGLEKQHHFQQVILGRFNDLTIGAHFLSAVCSELAVSFRAELLSVVESMNAKNRDAARAKFMQVACNDCKLPLSQEQYLTFSLENFPMQHSDLNLFKNVVQHLHPDQGVYAMGVITDFECIVLESSHVQYTYVWKARNLHG